MTQKAYTFDQTTLKKIFKGAIIAMVGALLTYLLEAVSDMDLGQATPIVVALLSIAANAVKEYRAGVNK